MLLGTGAKRKEEYEEMKSYVVEYDEIKDGMRIVVVFTDMGHRCGHVGVDKSHPLYEVKYTSALPEQLLPKWKKILDKPAGKRSIFDLLCCTVEQPTLGVFFDVHGGITFSRHGRGKYPVDDAERWYFGFDCAHYGDTPDEESYQRYFNKKFADMSIFAERGGHVRDKEYVLKECQSLAHQLKDVEELYSGERK